MRNPTPHNTPCAMTFFCIEVRGSETGLESEPDELLVEPEKVLARFRDSTPESERDEFLSQKQVSMLLRTLTVMLLKACRWI